MKIVIAGAGAAGVAAAKKVKKLDESAQVVLISADEAAYSRVMISKVIGGQKTEEDTTTLTAQTAGQLGVEWLRGVGLVSIDAPGKSITLDNGQSISYDKLLLATGSMAGKPPMPGLREGKNSFVLRCMEDARAIRAAAAAGEAWVVLGAGLVGMEAAEALCALGVKTAVIEMGDRVMPLQMDERCAGDYQRLFEAAGCSFYLKARLSRVELSPDGYVKTAVLEDGREIPCRGVVTAAGVAPQCRYCQDSTLAWDPRRGISVDEHLRTTDPDIYAAGDVTGLTGTWMPAQEQGETAAINMLGGNQTYQVPKVSRHIASYYGLSTACVGEVNGEGEIAVQGDRGHYRRVVTREGRVVGVLEQGGAARAARYQRAIEEGAATV
jgi:nitrite reductase (NADH) large subunit